MKRDEVIARINEIGIIPSIRVNTAEHALYAAETVYEAGIPVAEITMTVPGGIEVIRQLAQKFPNMVVGAGTVLDDQVAARCLDAGARFITSPGLILEVVDFALKKGLTVLPGALTPTEVIAAWKTGADYVKIFPASQMGFDQYIRSLKVPLPQISFVASGGVSQQTATSFIRAGATALGVGVDLLPRDALQMRQTHRIHELARRFLGYIQEGRTQI